MKGKNNIFFQIYGEKKDFLKNDKKQPLRMGGMQGEKSAKIC